MRSASRWGSCCRTGLNWPVSSINMKTSLVYDPLSIVLVWIWLSKIVIDGVDCLSLLFFCCITGIIYWVLWKSPWIGTIALISSATMPSIPPTPTLSYRHTRPPIPHQNESTTYKSLMPSLWLLRIKPKSKKPITQRRDTWMSANPT